MTDRKNQTAALRRRAEKAERLLAAEQERSAKAWEAYRVTLYELIEAKMRLEAVERALKGEA